VAAGEVVDDAALVVEGQDGDRAGGAEGGAHGRAGGAAVDGGCAAVEQVEGRDAGSGQRDPVGPSGVPRQRLSGMPGRFSAKRSLRPASGPVSRKRVSRRAPVSATTRNDSSAPAASPLANWMREIALYRVVTGPAYQPFSNIRATSAMRISSRW
jgi:hypothetical protein